MKIQILGSGCKNCQRLHDNTIKAAGELGIQYEIEKIQDFQKIAEVGAMKTPALAVNGKLRSSGRVLDVEEIKRLLSKT